MSGAYLIKDSGFHFSHIRETQEPRLGYTATTTFTKAWKHKFENKKNVQGHTHFVSKNAKLAKIVFSIWPQESVIEELGFNKLRILI